MIQQPFKKFAVGLIAAAAIGFTCLASAEKA
jgi:hypothetical protein